MATSHFSLIPLLSTLSLGSCVANLTHCSHDARNASGARMPIGSLFAWISRGPRRSWKAHHPCCTQGFSLGTHSYLCKLLLNHLQHHIHDVLVTGSSAHHTLSPRLSWHASVSHQSSGPWKPGVALHSWGTSISARARVAWLSTNSLLSLKPWLS